MSKESESDEVIRVLRLLAIISDVCAKLDDSLGQDAAEELIRDLADRWEVGREDWVEATPGRLSYRWN